ncbi:heavy metal translocating P-type ATPase metal-binding domain-containing protein [Pararhodospirillum photometricum]|uniref:heavy metal translocating P-type ATPase metal-binding domain-containing protein n=1 Tax=Pararhodospirillum photometricum TaxID=1084 RepID=UPI000318AA69|nr:heavy metal translocating P-type ATPase metal-binding domain-containing protein [Pararhodospirillum photometricum]
MRACLHCGQPVPPGSAGGPDYCCAGCQAARALIEGSGLGGYYERRCLDPTARPLTPDPLEIPGFEGHLRLEPRPDGTAEASLALMIEGLQCAACVWLIEHLLARQPEVLWARLNMTTRRLTLRFIPTPSDPLTATAALEAGADLGVGRILEPVWRIGYRLIPFDPERLDRAEITQSRRLMRALAVAGFAAGNIMMLSAGVWSGAGMGPLTRDLMHWLSALIAVPAVLYAVGPFARPALQALRAGHVTMDVPITLAVVLATAVSLAETAQGGEHAYFDAATMLLFFLLVGRVLENRARSRARRMAGQWLGLEAAALTVLDAEGRPVQRPPGKVRRGDIVLVATGERIGVDGTVLEGLSSIDASMLTGESLPQPVGPGSPVFAGTVNREGPLRLRTEALGPDTVLADIVRLMETATQGKARYVALADRVARLYGPGVHLLALATFFGWWQGAGAALSEAVMIATAVLIVTCPCALALAAPAVGVVACGRLLRRGILVKSPTALERLARIDHVVFDKTGTLTTGTPDLHPATPSLPLGWDAADLLAAAAVAANSRHPLARALVRAAGPVAPLAGVREHPGEGLSWAGPLGQTHLGARAFCLEAGDSVVLPAQDLLDPEEAGPPGPELWFARPGRPLVRFVFEDRPRADARETIRALRRQGMGVEVLSGDRPAVVATIAQQVGLGVWWAGRSPADKAARLADLAADGHRVLMVGDGLNDAPALAGASVSMSPTTALDLARTVADIVFQGERLISVMEAWQVARQSEAVIRQNLAFSLVYNLALVPLAMLGEVTPLIAAALMSGSSLVVTLNALRVGRRLA